MDNLATAKILRFPSHCVTRSPNSRCTPGEVRHGIFGAPRTRPVAADSCEFTCKFERLFELLGQVRGRPLTADERDETINSLTAAKVARGDLL